MNNGRDFREFIAAGWRLIGILLLQARDLIEPTGRRRLGAEPFYDRHIRRAARRLMRMAEFVMRRLIVAAALERMAAGEGVDAAAESDALGAATRGGAGPHAEADEVPNSDARTGNAPPQAGRPTVARWSMRLIEPWMVMRANDAAPRPPKPAPSLHEPLPTHTGLFLRARLDGLRAAMNRRHALEARMMGWFAARGPEDVVTPWRYGSSRTPFRRDKEHGWRIDEITQIGDDRLDAHIAARARRDSS